MISTVSTVKTSLPNAQRFVEGNLRGGVDHMIIFLDAADPEVEEYLASRREVSLVVCDKTWWSGRRPKLLNKRQRVNANVGRAVLSLLPEPAPGSWVFHVDADEIAQIDRSVLARVPPDRPAVNLRPLEVVSEREPAGEPTRFKRLLDPDELHLLQVLGVLGEATNSLYFRSHIAGKVGIRPSLETWLGIHKASSRREDRIPLVQEDGLAMLHYESYSGAEFVRKWTAMVGSGPAINFGVARQRLADAMTTLLAMDLPAGGTERYLEMIYDQYMADPIDLLDGLGLLETVDPLAGTHTPELVDDDVRAVDAALAALAGEDLRDFLPENAERDVAEILLRRTGQRAEDPPSAAAGARGLRGLRRRR